MVTEVLSAQPVAPAEQVAEQQALAAREYTRLHDLDPDFVQNLYETSQIDFAAVEPQPAVEVATERALSVFVKRIGGKDPGAAETMHRRAEISPRHHREHVEISDFIPGIAERPTAQQDFIGELIEIGQAATAGDELDVPEWMKQSADSTQPESNHTDADNGRNEQQVVPELTQTIELARELSEAPNDEYGLDSPLREAFLESLIAVDWNMAPASVVDGLIGTAAKLDEIHEPFIDNNDHLAMEHSLTHNILWRLPDRTLAKLYLQPPEQGQTSEMRRFMDTRQLNNSRAVLMHEIMHPLYLESGENMYRMPVDVDYNVDALRDYVDFARFEIETIPNMPQKPMDQQSILKYENSVRDLRHDILQNKLMLNSKMLKKMDTATLSRLNFIAEDESQPYIDGSMVKYSLRRIRDIMDTVRGSDIQRLHKEFGIVNLDMYTPQDLDTLTGLLDNDAETIEHLQQGDVTVVFTDAYGDHNGALTPVFDTYRKDSGRSLMFEVAEPGDFYRRMALLKRLGIKPSTVVIAGHGSPAKTWFGQGDTGFVLATNQFVSEAHDQPTSISIENTQLARLASDEYMQVSRGIDDPDERTGRRTFIFNSCSSDLAFKGTLPSSVETVVRTIGSVDVDGYGASSDMYLSSKEGHVIFSGKAENQEQDQPLFQPNGTKVSIDIPPTPTLKEKIRTKMRKRENGKGEILNGQIKNAQLLIKRTAIMSIDLTSSKKQNGTAA